MAGISNFTKFKEEKQSEIVSATSSYASYSASITSHASCHDSSSTNKEADPTVIKSASLVGEDLSVKDEECSNLKDEPTSDLIDKDTFDRLKAFVFIFGLDNDTFTLEELQKHFHKKFDNVKGVDVSNELERLGIVSLRYSDDRKSLLMVPRSEFMVNYEKRRRGIKVPSSDVIILI